MGKLTEIRVDFISLVKSPANEKELILKAHGKLKELAFMKFDLERKVAYGIVYAPDRVDTQGDFTDSGEIEKAAYGFMKSLKNRQVDLEHSFQELPDVYIGESWIVRKGDALFPDDEGAWAVGIKVADEGLWQELKTGGLTGISMAGIARRQDINKGGEEGLFERWTERVVGAIKDALNGIGITKKEDKGLEEKDVVKEEAAGQTQVPAQTHAPSNEVKKEAEGFSALESKVDEIAKNLNDRLTRLESTRKSDGTVEDIQKKPISEGII
jgi:hypothetical protein